MLAPRRPIALAAAVLLLCMPALSLAAELQLRESLLRAQRDRVTIIITAVVDHVGKEAHALDTSTPLSGDDCDPHVPLRSRDILVPVLGEVKNACSEKPAGTPRRYWSDRVYDETHGLAVTVTGVFRLWLEHPAVRHRGANRGRAGALVCTAPDSLDTRET